MVLTVALPAPPAKVGGDHRPVSLRVRVRVLVRGAVEVAEDRFVLAVLQRAQLLARPLFVCEDSHECEIGGHFLSPHPNLSLGKRVGPPRIVGGDVDTRAVHGDALPW